MNIFYRKPDRVSLVEAYLLETSLHSHSLSSVDSFIYSKRVTEIKEEISLLEPHQVNPLTHSFTQQMFLAKGFQFCQSFHPAGINDTGTFQKLAAKPPSGVLDTVGSQPADSSHPTFCHSQRTPWESLLKVKNLQTNLFI